MSSIGPLNSDMAMSSPNDQSFNRVNFTTPRSFLPTFKSQAKEVLFPDDPFRQFNNGGSRPIKTVLQYFIPIFEWLPQYNLHLFQYDLLAGITITSLAIPQGISYAQLTNIPPIYGLYSSFVPPIIYAVFGSSKHIAIGSVAAGSLVIAATIREKVSAVDEPTLYLHLVLTATLIAGVFQLLFGIFRLGILVDLLSHSTIVGFMSGTAILISLQQLKGIFGLSHFTTKTDVVSVVRAIFSNRNEWRWEPALLGLSFLFLLLLSRYLREKKPRLFWVSAMAPLATVILGGLFAYFAHAEKHGIQTVGHLSRGINPISIHDLNFNSEYLPVTLQTGIISGILAFAEGIAIGRSFAIMKNYQIDGNKEMIAFGLMNIVGSCTSCYLTSGPFSKSAVNLDAGCKTAMSNVVMAMWMMLTLLFLAPLFSYTPLVVLSAIILAAMFGLIDYKGAYRLFNVDKFDFCICIAAFFGVTFFTMDTGLLISVGLSILRAVLYVARPGTCKLGVVSDTNLYRDMEQYPASKEVPGMLILQVGSPISFANCAYLKERIARYIREANCVSSSKDGEIEHLLLDFGGVTSIDVAGLESLQEIKNSMEANGVKVSIINPRKGVMEKMMLSNFIDRNGRDMFFLSIEEAVEASKFSLQSTHKDDSSSITCNI